MESVKRIYWSKCYTSECPFSHQPIIYQVTLKHLFLMNGQRKRVKGHLQSIHNIQDNMIRKLPPRQHKHCPVGRTADSIKARKSAQNLHINSLMSQSVAAKKVDSALWHAQHPPPGSCAAPGMLLLRLSPAANCTCLPGYRCRFSRQWTVDRSNPGNHPNTYMSAKSN